MGYRRAAQLRRTQIVRGHWRRRKSGTRYYVRGHIRNGPNDFKAEAILYVFLFIAGFFTLGGTWLVALIALAIQAQPKKNIFTEMRESRERSMASQRNGDIKPGEYKGSAAYQAMLARHGGKAP